MEKGQSHNSGATPLFSTSTHNSIYKKGVKKEMAKKPMVTRTMQTTRVDVLCLDIVNGEPFNESVVLPRTYKDDGALLKAVEKVINDDERKAVHIVSSEVIEKLYGMTEEKFLEVADELPPRKAKSNE